MSNQQGQNLLNRCIMALQRAGVRVVTDQNTVTCTFRADPDDEHAAPDGVEVTYDGAQFALIVTRTFLELTERGVIDPETGVAV